MNSCTHLQQRGKYKAESLSEGIFVTVVSNIVDIIEYFLMLMYGFHH